MPQKYRTIANALANIIPACFNLVSLLRLYLYLDCPMNDFLAQARRFSGRVPFTKDAVALYYCMLDSRTPLFAKATITGALLYFLAPLDGIADFLPILGFTDDASVIAAALAAVASNISDDHRRQAEDFFQG